MKKTQPTSRKKRIFLLALLVLFLSGAAYSYHRVSTDSSAPSDEKVPQETVNYNPPDEEEKSAGDKQKDTNVAEQEKQADQQRNATPSAPQKTVSVVITDASQYDTIIEVRSFMPDHYQDGTCTITFKKDTKTITKQAPARKDISTTICTNPEIKRSEFPATGDWQVTVAYLSNDKTAQGSKSQTITIK